MGGDLGRHRRQTPLQLPEAHEDSCGFREETGGPEGPVLGVRRLTGPGAAAGGLSGEARGHRASCSHTKREAHPAVGVPWPWSLPQRAPRTWRASQLRAHWSRWRGQALPTILTSFPFSGHRTACPGERPAAVVSGRVRPQGTPGAVEAPGAGERPQRCHPTPSGSCSA